MRSSGRRSNADQLLRASAVLAVLAVCALAPAAARAQDARAFLGAGAPGAAGANAAPEAAAAPALPPPRGVDQLRSNEPQRPDQGGRAPAEQDKARPLPPPTDFQLFAATSVGTILPIFGQELFTQPPSTFAPVENLAASPDYVVGPGDELLIRGWGQVDVDVHAVVSREGTISLPRVGVVSVSGLRFQELAAHLKKAVSRYYRNFDLSVSLGRLRSIQVFVVGQTQRPGMYTLSSLSTVMNALFASGGPSPTGSVRRIQLRRGEKLVGEFDLYDLLVNGDKSKDQRLDSGDVIFIPPSGPVAAVTGRVKKPAIYELKGEATTLGDLVGYAGGLATTAATQSVLLERLDRNAGRVEQELPWNDASLATPLRDGDVVTVRAVSQRFENAVTLRGHVAFPSRSAWRKGMRISDLIPDTRALIPESYWARSASRAFERDPSMTYARALPRAGAEAQEQRALDRARDRLRDQEGVGPNADLADAARLRREGEPPTFEQRLLEQRARDERLQKDFLEARTPTSIENLLDEVNWDYAVVERLDRSRLASTLLPFNLRKAVVDKDPADDLELEPGDIVTVFSQHDIVTPSANRTYFVRVEGELTTPGIYQVKPGETLRQLIRRAGGFTRDAYLFGSEFNRESVRAEQQTRLDDIVARAEQDLDRTASQRLARALTPEDVASVNAQIEAQRAALARARTLRASGRMVLELAPGAANVDDFPDVPLEDGDRLFIPKAYSSVGVYGAVYNQGNFLYRPGKKVDDYLNQAGGATRSADSGSTYVLRADGSVMSKRQSGWFSGFGGRELMPNDSVVVPEDYAPTSLIKELKDWSQIFFQFGLGVAALKVLAP
jgi:protein involved in polysaccharide export with SLBB domain